MSTDLLLISIFTLLILLPVHSYLLYPAIISLIAAFKKRKSREGSFIPSVSIICSAYNEEKVIENRVHNIAEQNYDLSRIEMLIGSDCSSDRTHEILQRLESKYPWLSVIIFSERRGKAAVVNDLVRKAKNDILIFTDANTHFDKDALHNLVAGFQDDEVGGVCGRLILMEPETNRQESVEEKRYWEYETTIKKAEGKLGVLIGANGGIFAIRKELYREVPTIKAVTDDLFISLTVLSRKRKFVYNEDARAVEEVGKTVEHEVKRKIRFAATNYQTIYFFLDLLFNTNILLSYAFWTHKIIRWFLPFVLIACFSINILLLEKGALFSVSLFMQVLFYFMALAGYLLSFFKIRMPIFSLPYFFTVANIALLVGFFRFLRGKHSIMWQSTPR